MTIYLDLIWILNLCIDYLLIALTYLLLKRPFHHVRMIGAAFFASLIVLFLFTSYGHIVYEPWFKAIYSIWIVVIAFGYKRFRYFFQVLCMFYFVTFMTGGGLFALHFFWQTESDLFDGLLSVNKGYGSGISWLFVCIGFPLVWYFSKQRFQEIEFRQFQANQLIDVQVVIGNKSITSKGLIDTGNQLVEPLSKRPVIIMEANLFYESFSKEYIDQLLQFHELSMKSNEQSTQLDDRLTIIPYRVVGQSSPFLTGIRPDYIKLYEEGGVIQTSKVLIALQDKELSSDHSFTSIIHPALLQRGMTKEAMSS
ncbi:sigma-E processing peptidase SpoIIGA [Halalkalibacter sp. APA_J-10(15)]|uniref:sigma-E processing peptidase SpoIIGA n=1 Tax=Halalkalibacter sp. APA_J-10(15) TaxID=2933805 RepID=UPI001FF6E28D|nr:sigma-E processing peptidase SpoIIGA [Halalkalibacter sp. APA_J-10(15)]MCK0470672.1 sigma-E processing peptidase SpoIIGA [Halalkalibacter sp. APA_J-10(15)]